MASKAGSSRSGGSTKKSSASKSGASGSTTVRGAARDADKVSKKKFTKLKAESKKAAVKA